MNKNLLVIWSFFWLQMMHEICCDHFLGGTMSWKYNAGSKTVQIIRRTFWRKNIVQNCLGDEEIDPAFTSIACNGRCSLLNEETFCSSSVSRILDWTTTERQISYTAASFRAWYSSCCWPSGGNWELKVDVDTTERNGTINTSPITLMFPLVRIQNNCNHMLTIPLVDEDQNFVMCRWGQAKKQECGDECNTLPFKTLNTSDCTLNLTGISDGIYAIALQIEDIPNHNSDILSLSSVPLQFRLQIYSSNIPCATLPEIKNNITSANNSVMPDTKWTYRVAAETSGTSTVISEIVIMSPSGVNIDYSGLNSNQSYADITWTPTKLQLGPHLFCFSAVDDASRMSTIKCLTLWVGAAPVISRDGCMNNGGRGPCAYNCTLTENPFQVRCSCQPGFILLEDGRNCLGQPRNVSWNRTPTSIAADWIPPEIQGSSIPNFTYSYSCTKVFNVISTNTGFSRKGIITALEPFTYYSCCILAYTSENSWSQACSTVQTLESVPETAPINVNFRNFVTKGNINLNISWNPPISPNGNISGHNIYIFLQNTPPYVVRENKTWHSISGLKFGQAIGVIVSSNTSIGEGRNSTIVNGTTVCEKHLYYDDEKSNCVSECGCGKSQEKNPQSGAKYCITVQKDSFAIRSLNYTNSISPNTTIGTQVATVTITHPNSEKHPFLYLSSKANTEHMMYPVVFGITNTTMNDSEPTYSGEWNSNEGPITKHEKCVNYYKYTIPIYVRSAVYPQGGDWLISLKYDSCSNCITTFNVKVTTCPPSQRFDIKRKQCVGICSCGYIATETPPICALSDSEYDAKNFGRYWEGRIDQFFIHLANQNINRKTNSLFSFVHRQFNFTIPFDNVATTKIMSNIYFLDNHILRQSIVDWVLTHPVHIDMPLNLSMTVPQLFSLRFNIIYRYSRPVLFETEEPNLVLTFQDGSKVSSTGIIDLRGNTMNCTRSDGVVFQSIPFNVSINFKDAITSLSTHVFSVNATAVSTTNVYQEYTKSFFDTMTVHISVGPGTNGSLPEGKSCITENRILTIIDFEEEGMMKDVKSLAQQQDSISDQILTNFPFGKRSHTKVFVSSNGLISFDKSYGSGNPERFPLNNGHYVIAPFWTRNYVQKQSSVLYANISKTNYPALFKKVDSLITSRTTNQEKDEMQWMMIVQWNNIPNSLNDKENSYQAIITTTHLRSYAIFTYDCSRMGWSGEGEHFYAAVGFDANGELSVNHPASRRDYVAEAVACANKRCFNPINHIVYTLDALSANQIDKNKDSIECRKIINEMKNEHNNLEVKNIHMNLLPCPPDLEHAYWDFARFRIQSSEGSVYCFVQQIPTNESNQQCCYSNIHQHSWRFDTNFNPLLTDDNKDAGSMLLYDPRLHPQEHQRYDLDFKKFCCGIADMCKEYRDRRPWKNFTNYQSPNSSWDWGDPHITTLDGRTYTFNGWGEYILLQYSPPNNGTTFTLQARMVPWNMTSATQFSAVAFGNRYNGSCVEIGIVSKDKFYVYVDGKNISSQFQDVNSTYSNENVEIYPTENNSIRCVMPMIGFGITISSTEGAMSFVLLVPASWQRYTTGLLGNFNGNKSDDFVPRGSKTAILDSDSDRNIHFHFAQTWYASQLETMFSYFGNTSWQFYSHPTHLPVFADEIVPTDAQTSLCGKDIQCIYDLSQTNSTNFAMETAKFGEENILKAIIIKNMPPVIYGSHDIMVKVNCTYIYMLTVVDDDNFTVGVVDGIPFGASLTGNHGSYSFSWTLLKPTDNFSLTFYATDSQNASSILSVQVQQCACLNNGSCTLDGAVISDRNNVIMNCDCTQAYSGQFCENDRNGCAEFSCYPGVQCYDVPAPGVGIRCGPCPIGYIGNGKNCTDIDECKTGGSTCDQTCTNTPGHYECSCDAGYTMTADEGCSDVDECLGVHDCQHRCINTYGSYYCECDDGFELDSNEHSCTVSSACPEKTGCSDLCAYSNGTSTCFCFSGYILSSDKKTCIDINECDLKPCEQKCINTIGSFVCACDRGYALGANLRSCDDINECKNYALIGDNLCETLCVNTRGSYYCTCSDGYIENNGTCKKIVPPIIRGEASFVVIIGQISVYQFSVEDASNSSFVGVVGGIPSGAIFTRYEGMYQFSWLLNSSLENTFLIFYATDLLNYTTQHAVQVQFCNCQNGGRCISSEHMGNNTSSSVLLNCTCPTAYSGQFCQNDRDGCSEISCYKGVQCYDIPAPGVGGRCGPCPLGYTGNGISCTDIDECINAKLANILLCPGETHCFNTKGSYVCDCLKGYIQYNGTCKAPTVGITWNGMKVANNSLVTLSVVLQRANLPSNPLYPLVCHNISGGQWYSPNGALYPAALPITTPGGYGQRNGSAGVELYRGTPSVFPHGVQCCTNATITLCVGLYTDLTLAASVSLAATNPSSYALSAAATYGPKITEGVKFQLLTPTNFDPPEFQLTCTSTSSPPTDVMWTINGNPVNGSNYSSTQTMTNGPTSTYNNTLTVVGRAYGTYTCNITTTCSPVCGWFVLNKRSIASSLIVIAPPNTPTNVTAKRSGQTSVNVSWTAPTSGGPVTTYDIYYVAKGGSTASKGSTNSTFYVLTNLQAGVPYNISVAAVGAFMPSRVAFTYVL